jgi:nitrite reductase/ring-hydroxylating ferredoxin subunit
VQVPIGAWTSAAVLDALPGTAAASGVLIGVGVAAAIPAAVSGLADWSQLHEQQKRVGLVHAAANVIAVGLYGASLFQRARGKTTSGKVLSYLGLAVVSGAGFLGGHLAYRQAAGANHVEDVPHRFPTGWQTVGPIGELANGELESRTVAGVPLLLLRRGSTVDVIADACSHLSGPLHEGELIDGEGSNPCVACPWHGSVFSLSTGDVVHGPATAPQPKFETLVREGVLEVLLVGAG